MLRVFVTGASGFLGRRVVAHLREHGHRVTTLGRRPNGRSDAVVGDLSRPADYNAALHDIDVVVHLAALTGRATATEFQRVNVEGTRLLVEAAHRAGVQRFLFCSTIAVTFADTRHYPYAESKAAAETIVSHSRLRPTIIRPTIIGGPGSAVISGLATLAALPVIPLFGGGHTKVQPIHVDDLASLIHAIVASDRFAGEVLELGGPDVVTLRDILDRLRRRTRQARSRFVPVPMGLLLPPLRLLEAVIGPRLPLTIGQLATFRFDGVARPNTLWETHRDRLASIGRVIDDSVTS